MKAGSDSNTEIKSHDIEKTVKRVILKSKNKNSNPVKVILMTT